MKNYLGILGYTFLILGAFFIDTPIIALLFIPLFLAGMIMLLLFYNKKFKRNNKMGMLGILIICLTLGYTCIEFNQFLVLLSRNEFIGFTSAVWLKIVSVTVLTLIASFLISRGLGKESINYKSESLFGWWLSASLVIPFELLIYWIAYSTENWAGG
ncbi:hypothetical protein [Maribellus mangrovi]|uniref:hypothetical protein n=1 Tax=Maribellus mangrovi TaxID=3133146 RepID=UPI0030EE1D94